MKQRQPTSSSGFTIVELMVSLAVASILIGIAIPAFTDFIRQRTLTTGVNDMVLAITYARSEAVRRGETVSVEALDPDADNEWGGGYCVVVGAAGNCAGEVLRRFEPAANAVFDGVGALNNVTRLSFNARGMLTPGVNGSILLCRDGVNRGRALNVNVVGRTDVDSEWECG